MVKIFTKSSVTTFGELKIGDTFESYGNIYMKLYPVIFAVDYCGYDSEEEVIKSSSNALNIGSGTITQIKPDVEVNKVDLEIAVIPCVKK